MTVDRSARYVRPKLGELVATMEVVGVPPLTRNVASMKRATYRAWLAALDAAAGDGARQRKRDDVGLFSVRMELRLYDPGGQGSDLDNYVKPIQDAMARHGTFGPTAHKGSTMRGDEHVDHLEVRRRRVNSAADAGVLVEVWSLA